MLTLLTAIFFFWLLETESGPYKTILSFQIPVTEATLLGVTQYQAFLTAFADCRGIANSPHLSSRDTPSPVRLLRISAKYILNGYLGPSSSADAIATDRHIQSEGTSIVMSIKLEVEEQDISLAFPGPNLPLSFDQSHTNITQLEDQIDSDTQYTVEDILVAFAPP
ncbi:hypothetical protein CSAL01_13552 [Colletotrichum salicis]|uniref:SEA domain-containing protein n=1 Tax=Colletotrichum salicis TaxID=1209931 RepID=A0A135UVU8_9PEZI|nr:hypothetical protein CSAL01_13552 [Colletotrichum salicis]